MSENLNAPVDLHTHSNYSDGELSPLQLVDYAQARGVTALAITDHDTVDAYRNPDLGAYAESTGVEIVNGVEISTEAEDRRFHILGLCIDPSESELLGWLDGLRQSRDNYTYEVIAKLGDCGWYIDAGSLPPKQVHTKAHVSEAVIADPRNMRRLQRVFGHTPNRGEYIERFMNPGQECYVPRILPTTRDAISIIHQAGGLAFLAHPVAYMYEQGMSSAQIIEAMKDEALDGLEAIYYYYYKSGGDQEVDKVELFTGLAKQNGLLVSGGSDFHGSSPTVGNYMDIGYNDKLAFPTVALLRFIQEAAYERRQR